MNAVGGFDLHGPDWIKCRLPVRCLCWGRGRVWGGGGWAVAVMSEARVVEDGWPRSTRSRRNVPTVPLGDREVMIHFQHHFTRDDLITLCEWTVPAMRTHRVCRASTLKGVSYEALHAPALFVWWLQNIIGRWEGHRCDELWKWWFSSSWLKNTSYIYIYISF